MFGADDQAVPLKAMHQLWATMCAIEQCHQLPFTWVVNPHALASEQRTIADAARDSVQAATMVESWRTTHCQNLHQFRIDAMKERVKWDALLTEGELQEQRLKWWKDLWRMLCRSHPWVAIAATSCTERFSRAQRVVVQANNLLVMLMVTMMLFYSKSTTECACYYAHLGCGSIGEQCWEETTCFGLYHRRDQGLLPEHLDPHDQSCFRAFPDTNRWQDRCWSSLISIAIMLPIARTFSALFILGGTPVVPRSLRRNVSFRVKNLLGTPNVARVEMLWFAILTVIFDQRHLGQAFSSFFQYVTRSVDGVYVCAERAYRQCRQKCHNLHQAAIFLFRTRVLKRDPGLVLQDLEVHRAHEMQKLEEMLEVSSTFHNRHEMDSLLVKACYTVVVLWWMVVMWLLLTYTTIIRMRMGAAAEVRILQEWMLAVAVDNLGVHALKTFAVKFLASHITAILYKRGKSVKADMYFYEEYVYKKLGIHYSLVDESGINRTGNEGVFSVNHIL
eukprot:gene3344-4203_t